MCENLYFSMLKPFERHFKFGIVFLSGLCGHFSAASSDYNVVEMI